MTARIGAPTSTTPTASRSSSCRSCDLAARTIAATLPRSYEVVVRGRLKFRIGSIVYVAFSRDETIMELAFPKDWRAALVDAEPERFSLPRPSDLRFHWI